MTTVLALPENIFNIEVYSRSTWSHSELNLSKFSGFLWKKPLQKEKGLHKLFWRRRKTLNIFKNIPEKKQKFQSAVLDYSKPKIFFVGQPCWPTFFQTLLPLPTILVLLRPCLVWNNLWIIELYRPKT